MTSSFKNKNIIKFRLGSGVHTGEGFRDEFFPKPKKM